MPAGFSGEIIVTGYLTDNFLSGQWFANSVNIDSVSRDFLSANQFGFVQSFVTGRPDLAIV
jgi:hypothetical protein